MSAEVEGFLTNGDLNTENFYVDDDARAPAEGTINMSCAGIFTFNMLLAAPFTVALLHDKSAAKSKVVKAVNGAGCKSVKDTLVKMTSAYLDHADEIDEEYDDGEDDEGGCDDDMFDQFQAQSISEAAREARKKQMEMDAEFDRIKEQYDTSGLNKGTVERILKDYENVRKTKHFGWKAVPEGRNLANWRVDVFDFESELAKDMKQYEKRTGKSTIEMQMTFPAQYPFKPPFVRVIRPRFMFRTGRVTVGGSICTELLTDDGWKPIYDIESILETIRQQITDKESGARIDHSNTSDYTEAEAKEAFQRVAAYHKQNGW